MNDIVKIIGIGVIILVGAFATVAVVVGLVALSGLIIWLLWNALVPALIAGGPTITYWQAILLSFVLSIISSALKSTSR